MIDLNAAAIFVAVVEAGGFSAAARALGSPKTTVSKRIVDLERGLGVRLLNRTTRRVSMTVAGEEFYGHCVTALRHMETAARAVRAAQDAPVGMLTVGAPGPIGAHFLLPAITAFMHAYPAIDITHRAIDTPVDLASAGVDVLLVVGTGDGQATGPFDHVRAITSVEIGLFASADYITAHGIPAHPHDLRRHIAIAQTQALIDDRFAWVLRRDERIVTVAPDAPPRLRSNDAAAILAAVVAGYGIGALAVRFVAAAPQRAALVPVLPEWRVPAIELSAHYRDGSSTSLRNRLFLDFITEWFRAN